MDDAIRTAMRVFSTWRTSGELQLDRLRDALTVAPEPASLAALEAGPSDQRIFVASLVSALVESGLEVWDDDEALRLGIDWLRRDLHALDLGGLLRLARLATALDDPAASDEATLRAIAIDPLVRWWSDLDVEAERIEDVETRELARAITRRRASGRWSPVGSSLTAPGEAVRLVHAAELLRAALRGEVVDLEVVAELDALVHPHAPVLGVVGALVRGDEAQAADRLRALLGDLAADDPVAGVLAALRTELFRPPHELESVLRRIYFEAVVDPFGSLEVPASAFASFRRLMAGLVLAAVLGSSGHASADVPEETATQSSEADDVEADDVDADDVDSDPELEARVGGRAALRRWDLRKGHSRLDDGGRRRRGGRSDRDGTNFAVSGKVAEATQLRKDSSMIRLPVATLFSKRRGKPPFLFDADGAPRPLGIP